MNNVYVFRYDANYGDGMMLIAALNKEEAVQTAEKQNSEMRYRWEFSEKLLNVFTTDPSGTILAWFMYVE